MYMINLGKRILTIATNYKVIEACHTHYNADIHCQLLRSKKNNYLIEI